MITAVLDVNVLLSAIIAPLGYPRQVVTAWYAGRVQVTLSKGIIAEVVEKLRTPRIGRKYGVTDDDVRAVLALLESQAAVVVVSPQELVVVTGDPEDDGVLATARLSGVQYLVTGDLKLLDLGQYAGVRIVSPRAFVEVLGQSTAHG